MDVMVKTNVWRLAIVQMQRNFKKIVPLGREIWDQGMLKALSANDMYFIDFLMIFIVFR